MCQTGFETLIPSFTYGLCPKGSQEIPGDGFLAWRVIVSCMFCFGSETTLHYVASQVRARLKDRGTAALKYMITSITSKT